MPAVGGDPLLWLELAGESFVLSGEDVRWRDVLARRYGAFGRLTGGGEGFAVALHATAPPPADWRHLQPMLEGPSATEWRDGAVLVTGPAYRLAVDLARRAGEAWGPLQAVTADMLLRLAVPLLIAADGLVLHGAMLEAPGRAWLCVGPSGCGKSTLARLMGERSCCDELSAVRLRGGCWTAGSLPFWRSRPARAPLQGIHLLRHGEVDERRRLSPAEAAARLRAEVHWPHEPAASAAALQTFAALVQAVPVWDLSFRPTAEVWDVLSAPADGAVRA